MRALAIVAALLVLATPLVGAQSGDPSAGSSSSSSSGSPSSSSSPTHAPEPSGNRTAGNGTQEPAPYGDDASDDFECPPDRAPATPGEKRACYCARPGSDPRVCDRDGEAEDAAGEWRRWCKDEARADVQRERCRRALDEFRAGDGRDHQVTFQVDAANRTLYDYRIDGRAIFDALLLDTGSDNLTVQRVGSALRIGDHDTELVLHDDPSGLVRFKASDGSLTVRLADGATVQRSSDGAMARVVLPDGGIGHLRAGNVTWLDASTLLVSDFFAFLLPPAASPGQSGAGEDGEDGAGAEVEAKVGRAITDRKVGAEIEVSGPAPASAAGPADPEADGTVRVLAYDDVDVQVKVPSDVATPEAPIRVRVSAELDEGRTIVLKLDRSVLESADAGSLVLRYFDLYDQADGSEVETEVVFQAASDLQDVLDPADDSGQPEYWVVEDANGLQVLVSVPHWSAHAITVGSVGQVLSNPSVIIGIAVGLAGSVVAGVAMLWPRRPDDE